MSNETKATFDPMKDKAIPTGAPGAPAGAPGEKGPGGSGSEDATRPPATARANRGKRARNARGTFFRLMGFLFKSYPVHVTLIIVCIVAMAILTSFPTIFMQKALVVVGQFVETGDWAAAMPQVRNIVLGLIGLYVIALIAQFVFTQLGAIVTQGTLRNIRDAMFAHMQDLPIGYFDTHKHGDVMSYYTNDVDVLRQLIGQALPNLLNTILAVVSVIAVMLWYSLPLTLVVACVMALMFWLVKVFGGRGAKFFLAQQRTLAAAEGFAEEAMSGQKVIKVFTHEADTEAQFKAINNELFQVSKTANIYGSTLIPVLMNLGNLTYVLVALFGGIFMATHIPNPCISGLALTIDIVVPFLNLTKRLAASIGQISNQINFVIMGLAGSERIFDLLDQQPEQDEGFVTLVNTHEDESGELVECSERTNSWAWKYPQEDGSVRLVPLAGDVRLKHVDFEYRENHPILHDISLYAKPGQKVAFVGATGAGKTTITNLLNRFYDIKAGEITYDGIDIAKIRKEDLRSSLGIVLQDVNLFTGTVMDNIRYGRLDATDEDCIEAARLAGADSFIERLPHGYQTMLSDNAASLSQGQRQLLSIARAAVANPPVLILDEATSSIDTRTEQIVQRGMDALMHGRTNFVIAHRLSTVRNSNVIIVLDHGRIIERGNHDELIAQKGTYYQLYTGAFELE